MIAPRDMGFGKGGPLRFTGGAGVEERTSEAPEARVLVGSATAPRNGSIWSREPLATVRAEPKRFLIGVPIVFLGALGLAAAFLEVGFEVALGALLVTQCLGFVLLYVPALRKRTDPMRNRLLPRNDDSPIDQELAAALARARDGDGKQSKPKKKKSRRRRRR